MTQQNPILLDLDAPANLEPIPQDSAMTAKPTAKGSLKRTHRELQHSDSSNRSKKQRKGWRLQAKRLFLTYPQCSDSKKEMMQRIKTRFGPNLEYSVVAKEQHKDGTPHLHALIVLKQPYRSSKSHDLDVLTQHSQHGNYTAVRNLTQTLKYIAKEGNYLEEGISLANAIASTDQKKSTRSAIIAMKIQSGSTLRDLMIQDPGYMLLHGRRVKEYLTTWTHMNQAPPKIWKELSVTNPLTSDPSVMIKIWLNTNVLKDRHLRQPQLYVHGPGGIGKTTMIMQLAQYLRIYYIPTEDFYDFYDDKITT